MSSNSGRATWETEELRDQKKPVDNLQDWIEESAAEEGKTKEEIWKELEEEFYSLRDSVKKSKACAEEDEAAEKAAFLAKLGATIMPEETEVHKLMQFVYELCAISLICLTSNQSEDVFLFYLFLLN